MIQEGYVQIYDDTNTISGNLDDKTTQGYK